MVQVSTSSREGYGIQKHKKPAMQRGLNVIMMVVWPKKDDNKSCKRMVISPAFEGASIQDNISDCSI